MDADRVFKEITHLHDSGLNIWYDEGIRPGVEWTAELADAITAAQRLIFFASDNSMASRHCRDEIQFAMNHDIPVMVVMLEDAALPPSLELTLGSIQAVNAYGTGRLRAREQLVDAIKLEPRSAPPPMPTRKRAKPWRAGLAVAAGIFVLAALVVFLRPDEPAEPVAPDRSVALLPFTIEGGFDNSDLPESLAEDLLNRLVSVDGLRVASRRASFALADTPDLVAAARQLNVRSIISGNIRRTDSAIRLYLELIDVTSGAETVQWSRTFRNEDSNAFLYLLSEATQQLATQFFPEGLSNSTRQRLTEHSTDNPLAFEYYLQAQALIRNPSAQSTVENAAQLYQRAIDLDPRFAWARAGLCRAYVIEYVRERNINRAEPACSALIDFEPKLYEVRLALGRYFTETGQLIDGIAELEAALKQNSNSADLYELLGRVYGLRYVRDNADEDRSRAEAMFTKAFEVEPNYWGAHHAYAIFLGRINDIAASIDQFEQAIELAPNNMPSLNNLANLQLRLNNTEQAIATWQKSLTISDDNIYAHSGLASLYYYNGNFDQAAFHGKKAASLSPLDHRHWGLLADAYSLTGSPEASTTLNKAIELAQNQIQVNESDWETMAYLGLYQAMQGEFSTAKATIADMYKVATSNHPNKYLLAAQVHQLAGDSDLALEEVGLALAAGLSVHFVESEPTFQQLRAQRPDEFDQLISNYRD